MSAIKYFSSYDNSTRINLLVNCEYLSATFAEEDMKAVDINILTKQHKNHSLFNYRDDMCNAIYLDNGKLTLLEDCIQTYNPVHICTIKCGEELNEYLVSKQYLFHSKTKLLHIYTRSDMFS